ncbi:MAG: M14 family metallocarboxypeptidase [Firmicutes bacterium]|nr:M14 family metallocarboxypeptidase [Bacillota bacterium]
MPIVQTELPTTAEICVAEIEKLTEAYPFCRSEELAVTAFGRPIRTLVIGSGARKVLYSASHHANEWITTPLLLKFCEELAEAIASGGELGGVSGAAVNEAATIYMVPMVNPDGVDLVTGAIEPGSLQYEAAATLAERYPSIPFPEGWKANLLGVDLNLNYPAGWLQAREIKFEQGYTRPGPRDYVGRSPLSQAETRALAGYTEAVDPALVLAYHTQGREIYWQYADMEVPGAQALGEQFAALSGYRLAEVPYESSFAGYKDWFIRFFGRPGYTIEAGAGTNPLPLEQFTEIYRDNLPILLTAALGI